MENLFYHLIDIALVNGFILYNTLQVMSGRKVISENDFCDKLVLEIISKYGRDRCPEKRSGRPSRNDCRVKHGSMLLPVSDKSRCQYCHIKHGRVSWTQRKCLDCIGTVPSLCQTLERDCHSAWHYPSFDSLRNIWFDGQTSRQEPSRSSQAGPSSPPQPVPRCGRPRINKRRRRGMYRKGYRVCFVNNLNKHCLLLLFRLYLCFCKIKWSCVLSHCGCVRWLCNMLVLLSYNKS